MIPCLDSACSLGPRNLQSSTGLIQLNNKLSPPANLSTLQRNFSFIFLSLLTESTSAVNSAPSFLNSVSPGGSRLPLLERPDSCHFPVGFKEINFFSP
ncbi:hypothetical protein CHARACLAT_017398 [Characodon lateralis]|uniref:Uncharacterized protein n=1 Tax=Characodon lateralis TaxID=208331 RepID=A0ABU7E192_9TELE|nr:hypothetical protein [Characodon lateralis]